MAFLRPLLSLSALLLLASCTPRRTLVDEQGNTVGYDEAAADAFRRAKGDLDAGHNNEAAKAFAAFVEKFGDTELADEARLRRGQALARGGKLTEARGAFEELLEKFPLSKFKRPAAVELSNVQAKLGIKSEATKPVVEEMSQAEKKEAAAAIAESFSRAGDTGEGARWGARAVEGAPEGPEREARLKDFAANLEQAPATDVAKIVAELDRKSPAWPPAALKLARILLHIGDRAHAMELSAELLTQNGQGPIAEGARQIQQEISGANQVKPALIGIVLPLTGAGVLKSFADQVLNAVALSVDLQNRGSVQVEVKDTKGDPEAAAQAVEDLAKDGAIAIIGPIGPAEGLAAAVRAQQLGVPIISLSRAEGLTALGEFVFRDLPTSSAQARAVADYAQRKLLAKTFGILEPDSSYGDEMGKYFWDAVDQGGGEVRAFEHYPLRTTTFKPFIARMVGRANLADRKEFAEEEAKIAAEIQDPYRRRKALSQLKSNQAPIVDFDALFIPDGAHIVRLIAPAVAAEDVIVSGCDAKEIEVIKKTTRHDDLRTVQLLGTSLWDSPDLVDERAGAARYVQCAIFVDVFFPASERAATKRFVEEYDSAYHRQPGFLEAHAHDAAGILRKIVEEKRPGTRQEMRDLLAAMPKAFDGAAGETTFGKDREAQKPFFWLWINRGNIQEFDPEGPPPVPPATPAPAPGSTPPPTPAPAKAKKTGK